MERTVLRILGKKGRTTIPWPIRAELDFCPGDVLLFEADPPDRVVITRMEVYEPEEVEEYMRLALEGDKSRDERLRLLDKRRGAALDEIHLKERKLERLDYLRYMMQKY